MPFKDFTAFCKAVELSVALSALPPKSRIETFLAEAGTL